MERRDRSGLCLARRPPVSMSITRAVLGAVSTLTTSRPYATIHTGRCHRRSSGQRRTLGKRCYNSHHRQSTVRPTCATVLPIVKNSRSRFVSATRSSGEYHSPSSALVFPGGHCVTHSRRQISRSRHSAPAPKPMIACNTCSILSCVRFDSLRNHCGPLLLTVETAFEIDIDQTLKGSRCSVKLPV